MEKQYRFLDNIQSPADLRRLNTTHLIGLCGEIRHFLLHTVSKTGGHLASNLGAVELTVALHRVFESPTDQIVWDVGHQCYTHKLLTGRRQAMDTLRREGGLSGFTKSTESPHDAFVSGHSSTSIAVADGIAKAKRIQGQPGRAIAVIGDGAFTGGMAFEGLNNAARGGGNPIIILNDNHMSISKNAGALPWYLSKLRAKPTYFTLKDLTKSAIGAVPVVGDRLVDVVSASKAQLKNVVYSSSFFEEMGYAHMGPVDGHDLPMLCAVLSRAKALDQPVFIHVVTRKGKGYLPAEENPGAYHGVGPFSLKEGVSPPSDTNFSGEFGRHLTKLAIEDRRVVAVTAAMKYGTGLHHFSREFKESGRFFDVGIAEQHGVTFAAGLAAKGLVPVFAVYSSFLQRAYDQLLHDCAIEPRHVILGVDRAGLVGDDGETHQGLFDCAFLSTVPGSVIYSPADYWELQRCLERAVKEESTLTAVRYPRGGEPELPPQWQSGGENYTLFDDPTGDKGMLLVTYGRLTDQVTRAAGALREVGQPVSVMQLTRVWPMDAGAVADAAAYHTILFAEEGVRSGGIGEHMLQLLFAAGFRGEFQLRAVDGFVPQASVSRQMSKLGLDAENLFRWARSLVKKGNTAQ